MTERMIGLDEAVAVAEAPALPETAAKEAERKITLCISHDGNLHPVALPECAGVGCLKLFTGASSVQELQYDRAGNVYKDAEALKEHHVYALFPVDKERFAYFLDECGTRH